MNPLTPLELLDILEQKHGFESPALREVLERAKKVEELLELYREKTSTLSLNHVKLEKVRKIEIEEQIKALEDELKWKQS